jgi:hypothetical protein
MCNAARYAFLLAVTTTVLSCDSNVANSSNDPSLSDVERCDPAASVDENVLEATLLSLELSNGLEAPEPLWRRLGEELSEIRSTYGDEYSGVNTRHFPSWVPGQVMVELDDESLQLFAAGGYREWDTLNERFGVSCIDVRLEPWTRYVMLNADEKYNPHLVAEHYRKLPGVTHAGANGQGYINGGGPDLYVGQVDGDFTYLFSQATNSIMPRGLMYSEYWYVKYEQDHPVFVGYWSDEKNDSGSTIVPQPYWWDEAKTNLSD